MEETEGKRRMLERHEIIMRMTELNSEQLRRDNVQNGLDIELMVARNGCEDGSDPSPEDAERIAELERQIEALSQKHEEHRVEFENLQRQLLEFDEQTAVGREDGDN